MNGNLKTNNQKTTTILQVRDLTVYYDKVLALDDVSLNVNEGEIVAMIGPNGAGKSTTLKAICGLQKTKSGKILFEGENIDGKQPHQLVEKRLCLVPEGRRVFTSMTVLENLEMGAFTINDKKRFQEDIDKVYNLFPVLKKKDKSKKQEH